MKMFVSLVITVLGLTCTIVSSLPLGNTTSGENAFGCEPGEVNCSTCYNVLVNELFISDRNLYNLQRAFFPPDTANPVFVHVTYYFTRNMSGDGTTNYSLPSPSMNWIWTESSFYLFQPIESLQFTSLLFTDPSQRERSISLCLQPSGLGADLNMLKLLTQRVCFNVRS